jgi:large subunit ribosomal protein L7Ae
MTEKASKRQSIAEALFERRPKNFGIGQSIQPKRDLSRFVRWPRYVRLQRQRKILLQRLKVPPAIAQFQKTADKNLTDSLFRLLERYRPEEKVAKRQRLQQAAERGETKPDTPKPIFVKHGVNHVTDLIEQKKAKLVIIAHDVDPIELVMWMPALCRKLDIPYVIVKGKARLGALVHLKTATCLAVTGVHDRDRAELSKIIEVCKMRFNDRYEEIRRQWGGGVLGIKSTHKLEKQRRALAIEEAKRAQA